MELDGTSAGLEVELRIAGIGRFCGAAILALWLAGWAAGEAFALWILGVGAWSLLTGQPPQVGREPIRPEMALPVGLFLLFWLTFWTLGGVMAGRELLRLLFGRDRIRVEHDTLEIERSYGLFRSREKLKRDELRRFYCRPVSAALCVETARGTTELTKLGTAIERIELEQALNTKLHLAAQPSLDAALPETWRETSSLERDAVLGKHLSDTEDRVALARGYFNEIATHYNTRLEIVPERFVARLGKLKPQALMFADGFERAPATVNLETSDRPDNSRAIEAI